MTQQITKDSLQQMLNNPNPKYVMTVIGRALVAIYNRQTSDEKSTDTTRIHNNIGFAGCDAKSGSKTAKYFLKHNKLEQWMIDNWLKQTKSGYPRICKYHTQLNQISQSKSNN